MQEWWTYTLSDFLLFSPRTYYRLLERYNQEVWPGQVLTLGLGAVVLGLVRRQAPGQGRIVTIVLALLWSWVGWAFLGRRYASINWVATWLGWLFAIEALLLVWVGAVRSRISFRPSRGAAGTVGIGLFLFSLALYPLLAALLGRPWQQAEVFGVAPDPTVIATMGLLLLGDGRPRWELLVVPVIWCVISGATLWAMGSPEAWVPPLAALLAVGASARWQGRR